MPLPLTVTEAKTHLGDLVDQALNGQPVYIRRGRLCVQLVPAVYPDPIQVIPEGALTITPERAAALSQLPPVHPMVVSEV
jgi:antitoxin (DNA-binding transcriptional repressor) of toxin-antitoxin stability system